MINTPTIGYRCLCFNQNMIVRNSSKKTERSTELKAHHRRAKAHEWVK